MKRTIQCLAPQQLVDLIVDRELDTEDLGEALERLEHRADGWRELAMGFLESQEMRSACRHIANLTMQIPVKNHATEELHARHEREISKSTRTFGSRFAWAASLLVMFAVGWRAAGFFGNPQPIIPDITMTSEPAAPKAEPAGTRILSPEAISQPLVSDYVKAQLKRKGLAVEEHSGLYPVNLPDGRTALVPVRSVQVRVDEPKQIL